MVISSYKEVIRTSNDDGTERVEVVGCKMIDNGEEIEAKIVIPRLSKDGLTILTDNYTTNKDKILFTLCIPE